MEMGLRKGDPISPFLFVLATEVFNQMMKAALQKNIFKGLTVGHRGVNVSHLQFVDDTLFFCQGKRQLLTSLKRMLDCFQLLSGLKISFSKSSLIVLGRSREWGEEMVYKLGC